MQKSRHHFLKLLQCSTAREEHHLFLRIWEAARSILSAGMGEILMNPRAYEERGWMPPLSSFFLNFSSGF